LLQPIEAIKIRFVASAARLTSGCMFCAHALAIVTTVIL
jgi:hypothetical protein